MCLPSQYEEKAAEAATKISIKEMPELAALCKKLAKMQMHLVYIPGDGNCQFASVAYQLIQNQNSSSQLHDMASILRKQAVHWLAARGDTYSSFLADAGDNWNAWLENMIKPGTWGDNLTLWALANIVSRVIVVVSSNPDVPNYFITPPGVITETIYIAHYHEWHYCGTSVVKGMFCWWDVCLFVTCDYR